MRRLSVLCAVAGLGLTGLTSGVMLGLLTDDEHNSEKVAGQMGKTFAALFNTKTHLDVVFLNDEKDAEIRKACPPSHDRNLS